MTRFRLKSLIILSAAALPLVGFAAQSGSASAKPNVLMIVLDDLNDYPGVMGGHPQAKTPNMDRLAKQGVLFKNAHANVAVCSPSRASFMTGVHPTTSGCWGFGNWMDNEMLINSKTLGEYAMDNGYLALQTSKVLHNSKPSMWSEKGIYPDYGPLAYNGKKTCRHPSCPEGMEELGALDATFAPLSDVPSVPASGDAPGYAGWWNAKWGQGSPFRYESEEDRDLMTDEKSAEWVVKKIKQLEASGGETPFFMGVGIIRPHTPLVVPKKYFDMFPLEEVVLPTIKPDDMADVPWGHDSRGHKAFLGLKSGYADPEEGLRRHTQAYLACVAFADEMVGRVLEALEKSRFADNTIVLLFGDHGYHMGEKDSLWKYNLWEQTTRIPLIIKDPRIRSTAGGVVEEAVSLIDIFPTITDLCNWSGPTAKNEKGAPGLDGYSLRPFLENPATVDWDGPGAALSVVASWESTRPADQHLSIRTKDWRYTRYHGIGEELYDHRNDPYEWNNLASNPEYAEIKARLGRQLDSMIRETAPKTESAKKAAPEKSSDEQWKDKYFGWHPDADTDGDGKLSWAEYKIHKAALDQKKKAVKE
jgi:arylsulfatase A-like enzyme